MDTSKKNKAQHRKVDFGDMKAVEKLIYGWFGQHFLILFKAIEEYNRGLPLDKMKTAEEILSPELFRMLGQLPHVQLAMERIERVCFSLEYGLCANLEMGKIYCCESDTTNDQTGAVCLFYLRDDGAIVFELPALGMMMQQRGGFYSFSKMIETEFLAKVFQNRYFVIKLSSQYTRFYQGKVYALDIVPLTHESYRDLQTCISNCRRNVMLVLEAFYGCNFQDNLGSLSFQQLLEKENKLSLGQWQDVFEKARVEDVVCSAAGKEIFQSYFEPFLTEIRDCILLNITKLEQEAQAASDDDEDVDMTNNLPSLDYPYIVTEDKRCKRVALIFFYRNGEPFVEFIYRSPLKCEFPYVYAKDKVMWIEFCPDVDKYLKQRFNFG